MGVELKGARELEAALEKKAGIRKTLVSIVKQNGAELQTKAQRNAPVDTGFLRRSIQLNTLRDGGLTAEVTATAEYAGYVEFGTRFMRAQPYMRPAFSRQLDIFEADIKKALGD